MFVMLNNKKNKSLDVVFLILIVMFSTFYSLQGFAAIVGPESKDDLSFPSPIEPEDSSFKVLQDDFFKGEEFSPFNDSPESVRDLLGRSLRNLQAGQKEQAISELEKAWEMAPNQPATGVFLGYIYLQDKEYREALNIAEKLKKNSPDKPHGFIMEGLVLQGLEKKDQSKAAFKKALELKPGEPTAAASLADFALGEKNIEQARQFYLQVLKYDPGHLRTLMLLARLDASLGNTQKIEKLIKNAIETSPSNLRVHNGFAQIYAQLKKYPLAIQQIEKALEIKPDDAPSLFMHAKLLAYDGRLEASRAILNKLAASYPKKIEPREFEARVALIQNKPEDAIKLFTEALQIQDSTSLAVQLAMAHVKANDKEGAISILRERIAKTPTDLQLRALFAELLQNQGSAKEAEQEYAEIVRLQPNSAAIRNNYAWLLMKNGDIDSALQQVQKAYEIAPQDPNIMDTYGVILLKKEQYAKAGEFFQKAVDKLPDNLSVRFHLSQALVGMNKTDQAKKLLAELIVQKSAFVEREQAEALLKELKSH